MSITELSPPTSPTLNPPEEDPIQYKLDQIINSGLGTDQELTDSWYAIEDLLTEDGDIVELPTKPLKTLLEAKTLAFFEDYIDRMSVLDQCLEEIEDVVKQARSKIDEIESGLEPMRDPIYQLLDTLQNYEMQEQTILNQIEISDNFIEKFTLKEEEIAVLGDFEDDEEETGGRQTDELNWKFFKAFNKMEQIRRDALELLVKEGHPIGQDIVNSLVEVSEISYKRLSNWLKDKLNILQSGYPEVSLLFKWGVQVSKSDAALFESIISTIIDIRSKFILANFYQNLTKGGRAIDYNASDSNRYIGDILAWLHSTVVEEKDLLFNLLCISPPEADTNDDDEENAFISLPEGLKFSEYPEGDGLTLIDQTLQAVLSPISTKIRDTLQNLDHPMNSFQITNLIQFYTNLLLKLLGPASVTAEVFEGLVKDSTDIFFKISEDEMTQMIAEAQSPDDDLSVETNIRSILIDIKKILLLNESSDCQANEKIYTLERIVQVLLHPLFEFCDQQASFISEEEQSIYLTNCLHYIQSNLSDFKPIENHLKAMEEAINTHEDRLIDFQLSNWLHLSGLSQLDQIRAEASLADAMANVNVGSPKANGPQNSAISPEEVTQCINKFNQFLFTVDIEQDDPLGLSRLTSSALIRRIKKNSTIQFIDKYIELHDFVDGLVSKEIITEGLRSVNEIRTLLWVED